MPNPSPGRISVRTPPPPAEIVSGRNSDPLDVFMGNDEEISTPQVSPRDFPIQQGPLELDFTTQEQAVQLPTSMEIELEIDANICRSF